MLIEEMGDELVCTKEWIIIQLWGNLPKSKGFKVQGVPRKWDNEKVNP